MSETNSVPEPLLGFHGDESIKFTGSQINYYFICKRKLWLFSHNIELEPESDLVKLGKLLHENSYKRKLKEVQVDRIKIDFIERNRILSKEDREGEEDAMSERSAEQSRVKENAINPPFAENPRGEDIAKKERFETSLSADSYSRATFQKSSTQQKEIVIHEVKRSKKMQDAHLYQLLYYMYFLKNNYAVGISRGVLHYPLLKQNIDVPLTGDRVRQVEDAMRGITQVNSLPNPPQAVLKGYCRSCAYQDLCWG